MEKKVKSVHVPTVWDKLDYTFKLLRRWGCYSSSGANYITVEEKLFFVDTSGPEIKGYEVNGMKKLDKWQLDEILREDKAQSIYNETHTIYKAMENYPGRFLIKFANGKSLIVKDWLEFISIISL